MAKISHWITGKTFTAQKNDARWSSSLIQSLHIFSKIFSNFVSPVFTFFTILGIDFKQ